MTRRRLTKAEWAELYERQGGMCGICRLPLDDDPDLGPTEDDHTVARALRGGEEIDNRRLVHQVCHARKTNVIHPDAPLLGSDKAMIAKAKRIESKGQGRKRKGPKIPSRPFDRKLRRKLNGEVEPR